MFSVLYSLYFILITTFFMVLSVLLLPWELIFNPSRSLIHGCSRWLCMGFWHLAPLWRRRIEGLENVDKRCSYVIAINHNSMLDIMALYFVPLNFRWVSKREVFRLPLVGEFLLLHGDIAIERGSGAEAMHKVVEDGRKWIARGASVAIFPEGTRSKDGEIHRFKQGAFTLAQEAGVAILPVVMDGTRTVMHGWRYNWRNRLSIRVLPPVSAEEVAAKDSKEVMAQVQQRMVDALAELRKN